MDSIISREQIRDRARAAFVRGQSRDSHGMNPGALALVDWLAEYDHMTQCSRQLTQSELMAGRRVDRAQGKSC